MNLLIKPSEPFSSIHHGMVSTYYLSLGIANFISSRILGVARYIHDDLQIQLRLVSSFYLTQIV
jgi:hypothetical protein